MGTWALQQDKIPGLIQEIGAFKKRIHHYAGDDSLFDCLDRAIKRLEVLGNIKAKEQELSALLAQRKSLNEEIVSHSVALGYAVDADGQVLTGDYRGMFHDLFLPVGGVFVEDAWKLETVEQDEYMLCASGYLLNDEEDTVNG